MRPLSSNLTDEDKRPYFLWDEDISLREFKQRLRGPDAEDRLRMLARLMREARDIDVWMFITPQEAADALPLLARRLGRRQGFWDFLIDRFRRHGVIAR
jgi:hypothetical protein